MKTAFALLLGVSLGLVAGPSWSAAGEPVHFRFLRAVDRGAAQGEELLAVPLDSDVYAETQADWADLRLWDAAGTETPYLLERVTERLTERVRTACPSTIVTLREEGMGIAVHARLDEKAPAADGISFVTPLTNYERRVRVSGSNDGQAWTTLVEDGLIFDYSRYMDVASRDLALPVNTFREFQIVVEEVTDTKESPLLELTRRLRDGKEEERVERTTVERRPFRIDRLDFWHIARREVQQQAKLVAYPPAAFQSEEDQERRQTVLRVQTRREPLTQFTLLSPSRNFHRRVTAQVSVVREGKPAWQELAQATLFRFSFRSQQREELTVCFPERRETEYRLLVDNADSPPVQFTGVQAEGPRYRMVFLAAEGQTYRCVYGADEVARPTYDTAPITAALQQGFPPVDAPLSPPSANPQYTPAPLTFSRVLNHPVFLGVAIGLMVLVLGWGLFRAGRRLGELPSDDV